MTKVGNPQGARGRDPKQGWRPCIATRRDGERCEQAAMRGLNVCRMHGGSTPESKRKSARKVAEAAVKTKARRYGEPREVTPIEAMEQELHRTQGHVEWIGEQLANHPHDANWLAVYQQERGHLARLAHQMFTAKTGERQAMATEKQVDAIERAMKATLRELGHDADDPRVGRVVVRNLRAAVGANNEEEPTTQETDDVDEDASSNVTRLPARF